MKPMVSAMSCGVSHSIDSHPNAETSTREP
jgi:hypothetical protein